MDYLFILLFYFVEIRANNLYNRKGVRGNKSCVSFYRPLMVINKKILGINLFIIHDTE